MTDTADAERAERLARLNKRRAGLGESSVPAGAGAPLAAPSAPVAPAAHRRAIQPGGGKRRSPATTAKIVTVGASTTAVLGLMAGYGIADQAAASQPILLPLAESAAPDPIPLATAPPAAAPTRTEPPQVIVVVIDGATGRQVSGDFDLSTLTATPPGAVSVLPADGTAVVPASTTASAPGSTTIAAPTAPAAPAPAATAPVATPPAAPAPAPVAAPAAVDLAVPAPPPPPAAAPTPQPVATSGGS